MVLMPCSKQWYGFIWHNMVIIKWYKCPDLERGGGGGERERDRDRERQRQRLRHRERDRDRQNKRRSRKCSSPIE